MGTQRVLFDKYDDVEVYAHVDDRTTGIKFWEHQEDTEAAIERAKIYADLKPGENLRWVCSIPDFILERAYFEKWDKEDWRAWSQNPDYQKFQAKHYRTSKGPMTVKLPEGFK